MSRLVLAFCAACMAVAASGEVLPPLPDGAFTYVVIPDTQLYHGEGSKVRKGEKPQTGPTTNPAFESRVDWIVKNHEKENIVFVSHVGDITDMHNEPQWTFASNVMARLDGVVPYGISPGNHDLEVCTSDGFNRHFPRSRYAQEPWYAGAFDGYVRTDGQRVSGGNANSCQLFEAGGMKFVVLHLECNAPAPALRWADAMLEKHADRYAIVCTHMYLGYRTKEVFAKRKGTKDRPDEWFGLMDWTKCHKKEGVSAAEAWKTCFSKHRNLILIVSGDQGPAICWRETQTGENGNVVHAVMQDYPRVSDKDDWLRLYRFRPKERKIDVWTYSPRQGKVCETAGFRTGRDWHVFTLDLAPVPAEPFNVLVPVDWVGEPHETQVKELRKMRERYGLRKFVLIGPWHEQYERDLPLAEWERLGDSIAQAKRDLADLDVEIGWWVVPTLRGGRYRPFQHIMDCDGYESFASCPLDGRFRADFASKIAACARRAHPTVIFFEDDFTLSNHGGLNAMKGCFCPLHLAEYAKRTGQARTAKEIAEMFRHPTVTNAPLRQAFAELSRDSLAGLAAAVRVAIDAVDPSIRMCLCQSGQVDLDGDSTEAVARAFAGGTRPMVRVYGASYFNENAPMTLPGVLAHTFWSAQHLGRDIELIHETDPYPHTRFFNSSRYLFSELAAAVMAGVSGTYYYCMQYVDDPLGDDDGYARCLVAERRRLEAVRDLRASMRPCGVRAIYTPKEVYMARTARKNGMLPVVAYFLAKMGFPMTTVEEAPVAMLIGRTPNVLSDDEVRRILGGGVLIDAEAAVLLAKRGFGALMGCEAEEANGRLFFNYEAILPAAGCAAKGRKLYHRVMDSPPIAGWSPKKSVLAELKPHAGAEVWSAVYDFHGKKIAPATVFARNSAGGRIAVLCRSLDTQSHPSIYSPRKQEMMHNLFARLAGDRPLDVTAPKTPSLWLVAARNDRELLVMAENLCGEPRADIVLKFSPEWCGGEVSLLQPDGSWRSIGTASADFAVPEELLQPLVSQFFKVSR